MTPEQLARARYVLGTFCLCAVALAFWSINA